VADALLLVLAVAVGAVVELELELQAAISRPAAARATVPSRRLRGLVTVMVLLECFLNGG
jgi:hypothetical protein